MQKQVLPEQGAGGREDGAGEEEEETKKEAGSPSHKDATIKRWSCFTLTKPMHFISTKCSISSSF